MRTGYTGPCEKHTNACHPRDLCTSLGMHTSPSERRVGTAKAMGVTLGAARAQLVTVEARFEPQPSQQEGAKPRSEMSVTGLPDAVIRESRGRLLAALAAHQMPMPPGRLMLHLLPASLKKSGELLDLAMALGSAAAVGFIPPNALEGVLFLGEVALDGRLRSVPGGLAAADAGRRAQFTTIVAPLDTAREASALPGIRAFACGDLREVIQLLSGGAATPITPLEVSEAHDPLTNNRPLLLDQIRGQNLGKRAVQVAAAGGHGLLFTGPPGAGKSLLARALADVLPPPTLEERVDITRVLSAAGRWPGQLAERRSFRAPHHTTSFGGLVGGGSPPAPGEITLAHRGVLFLDELPEFRREVLEGLRQPLEEGRILISRAGRQTHMPADFQLVCAMNPCPCGYQGHPRRACRCAPGSVARYRQRISGPLLDRIDLRLEITPPGLDDLLLNEAQDQPSDRARYQAVRNARLLANERQGHTNARLDTRGLDQVVPLRGELRSLLMQAAERRALSARALQSLRRVARTLADLDQSESVTRAHLAEALTLRLEL